MKKVSYKRRNGNLSQIILAGVITGVMGLFVVGKIKTGAASEIGNIQSNYENASNAAVVAESVSAELQSILDSLKDRQDDLEAYLAELNTRYSEIQDEIDILDAQIAAKEQEIAYADAELESAAIEQDERYEAMKKRIQYLYENGNLNFIEGVLSAGGGIAAVLNEAEYYKSIIEYDRNQLEEYRELLVLIGVLKANAEDELEDLETMKEIQELKKAELEELMQASSLEIASQLALIDDAEEDARAQEIELESLYAQMDYYAQAESEWYKASEEASISESIRIAQGGEEETTTARTDGSYIDYGYTIQDGDYEWLAAIIYCEASDQSYYGMLCVGTVVMNRVVAVGAFADDVKSVISSPHQFSPYGGTRWTKALALAYAGTLQSECMQAAYEVLYDGYYAANWHFFRMYSLALTDGTAAKHPEGVVVGDHFFY